MRNKVIWLAAAFAGAGVAMAAYLNQPMEYILGNCSAAPPGPAQACSPGPYPMVLHPLDAASAAVWMIGGILIALGVAAFAWSIAGLISERRRARSANLPGS